MLVGLVVRIDVATLVLTILAFSTLNAVVNTTHATSPSWSDVLMFDLDADWFLLVAHVSLRTVVIGDP
jgi:hypothetical protein